MLLLVFQVRAFSISLFHKFVRSMAKESGLCHQLAMKSDREETLIGERERNSLGETHFLSFPRGSRVWVINGKRKKTESNVNDLLHVR
jgi:hypothetical protein